jgi:DNA-directed RNA polymerase subunit RPC12/RpoP
VARIDLQCPTGCEDGVFELLNAEVLVDRSGAYLRHRPGGATYVCATCQAVAVDLAAVAREMRRETAVQPEGVHCPACGIELLLPEDEPLTEVLECPACETRFGVEESRRRLHGGSSSPLDGPDG